MGDWHLKNTPHNHAELDDDAVFPEGDCAFPALPYRILLGKPSIYAKYGYVPGLGMQDPCHKGVEHAGSTPAPYSDTMHSKQAAVLRAAPVTLWKDIEALLTRAHEAGHTPRAPEAAELVVPPESLEDTLGNFLAEQDCLTKKKAYNDVAFAATLVCYGQVPYTGDSALRVFLLSFARVMRVHTGTASSMRWTPPELRKAER